MEEGSQSGSQSSSQPASDTIVDALTSCADTDQLRKPDLKQEGQQRSDSCHAWRARASSDVDRHEDTEFRHMKRFCDDEQRQQEEQKDLAGASSPSHERATGATLPPSSSRTLEQQASCSTAPPTASSNPTQQQHSERQQFLGLSYTHTSTSCYRSSSGLPLPLNSLNLSSTQSFATVLPSVSTAVEDAEDEMSQEYAGWALVCPPSIIPLLTTHASQQSGHGSSAAVLWALGSLQAGEDVYAGAHSGVPVQLGLTSTQEGVVAQVAWLPVGPQTQHAASQGEQQSHVQAQQQQQQQQHQQQQDLPQQAQPQQQQGQAQGRQQQLQPP